MAFHTKSYDTSYEALNQREKKAYFDETVF